VLADVAHRRYSINCIGWGLVAVANKRAEGLRRFGALRYDIGGAIEIVGNKNHVAKFTVIDGAGGETEIRGFFTTAILQMTVCSGSAMPFTPYSRLDSGKLDAIIAPHGSRFEGVDLFDKLKKGGRHIYNVSAATSELWAPRASSGRRERALGAACEGFYATYDLAGRRGGSGGLPPTTPPHPPQKDTRFARFTRTPSYLPACPLPPLNSFLSREREEMRERQNLFFRLARARFGRPRPKSLSAAKRGPAAPNTLAFRSARSSTLGWPGSRWSRSSSPSSWSTARCPE
jgi:hypothetical protein